MSDMLEFRPDELEIAERYKLLIGSIVPRPIGFISTVSSDGRDNLAPYSFFQGVGSNPMSLLFCPANKPDGSAKDSLTNALPIEEGGTGQFVANVAVEAYERQMAAAAEPLGHGESEFAFAGLTPAACRVVKPKRLAESPVSFECETMRVIRLAGDEPGGANIVLGRVLHIWVRDDLINERKHIDQAALAAIGRMGGLMYCRTKDLFEMTPGKAALEKGSGS